MHVSPDECAREVLEVVPKVMRAIRMEMRGSRDSDLSVPQFRVLIFLNRHAGASLSDAAEHIGLTLPSMSKMIEGLLSRDLVTRRTAPGDRRRVMLDLTELGRTAMESAYEVTRSHLAERLATLSAPDRCNIATAMQALGPLFVLGLEAKSMKKG